MHGPAGTEARTMSHSIEVRMRTMKRCLLTSNASLISSLHTSFLTQSCYTFPTLLALRLVRRTGVLTKQLIPEGTKLRASKSADLWSKVLCQETWNLADGLEKWCRWIGETGLGGLKEEAGEVVAVGTSVL